MGCWWPLRLLPGLQKEEQLVWATSWAADVATPPFCCPSMEHVANRDMELPPAAAQDVAQTSCAPFCAKLLFLLLNNGSQRLSKQVGSGFPVSLRAVGCSPAPHCRWSPMVGTLPLGQAPSGAFCLWGSIAGALDMLCVHWRML